MTRLASSLLALALTMGCGSVPKTPSAPSVISIATAEPASAPSAPSVVAAAVPPARCSLTLQVEDLEKVETCYLETRVQDGAIGQLSFPCDRQGAAEAVFDDSEFSGEVQGSELHLSFQRNFPYDDHCTWTTTQRIDGSLDDEVLLFSYEEEAPHQQGCLSACSATAKIRLNRADSP